MSCNLIYFVYIQLYTYIPEICRSLKGVLSDLSRKIYMICPICAHFRYDVYTAVYTSYIVIFVLQSTYIYIHTWPRPGTRGDPPPRGRRRATRCSRSPGSCAEGTPSSPRSPGRSAPAGPPSAGCRLQGSDVCARNKLGSTYPYMCRISYIYKKSKRAHKNKIQKKKSVIGKDGRRYP